MYAIHDTNDLIEFISLFLPIIISLIATIIFGIKFIKNNNFKKTLLITTVVNFVLLSLGTIWFWLSVPDGLAQLFQFIIYCICFVVIFAINVIVIMIISRKKAK